VFAKSVDALALAVELALAEELELAEADGEAEGGVALASVAAPESRGLGVGIIVLVPAVKTLFDATFNDPTGNSTVISALEFVTNAVPDLSSIRNPEIAEQEMEPWRDVIVSEAQTVGRLTKLHPVGRSISAASAPAVAGVKVTVMGYAFVPEVAIVPVAEAVTVIAAAWAGVAKPRATIPETRMETTRVFSAEIFIRKV
jgi:hypothetical protein